MDSEVIDVATMQAVARAVKMDERDDGRYQNRTRYFLLDHILSRSIEPYLDYILLTLSQA